jgi:hypothetical protein
LRYCSSSLEAVADRLEAVVGRLTSRYLPPERPDLRVLPGGREE